MTRNIIIFDLDGTLLDTLADLADAVNYALAQHHLPTHSYEAVRMMVGNGVRQLVERAVVPPTAESETSPDVAAPALPARGTEAVDVEAIFATFKAYYVGHCQEQTCLYPGILELLEELRRRGCRMAIVSNKLQAGVDELRRIYFDGLIDVAIGEREGIPRKPAPDMVNAALAALCRPGETVEALRRATLYVGDSDVDILTAAHAGVPCASVLWGFRDEPFLRQHGASLLVRAPEDLLAFAAPGEA